MVDYCPTGWMLHDKWASNFYDFDKKQDIPPELFNSKKCDSAIAAIDEHIRTCVQCFTEENRVNALIDNQMRPRKPMAS